MKARPLAIGGLLVVAMAQCASPRAALGWSADEVLARSAQRRGVAAVLGDPQCAMAIELARKSELTVYVQLGPSDDFARAARLADEAGLYGTRVYVERGRPTRIGLADNLADLVVVQDAATDVPESEALRVVNPIGRAFVPGKELTKPFPAGVDDWPNLNHGPDNNRFSRDTVIKAPYLTQFYAAPHTIPLPMARVAAAGRLFLAMGNSANSERERPWLNILCALDAYNGAMLWKRALEPGRLAFQNTYVATADILYAADNQSCKLIDARTGQTRGEIALKTPEGTSWKWIALDGEVLYAIVGRPAAPVATHPGKDGGSGGNASEKGLYGDARGKFEQGRDERVFRWGLGRTLLAYDLKAKKELWRHHEDEPMEGRTACMADGRIYAFRSGQFLLCVNAADGKVLWRQTPQSQSELFKSVMYDEEIARGYATRRSHNYMMCVAGVLLFRADSSEGPSQNLAAVSAKDGKLLWRGRGGYFLATPAGQVLANRQWIDLATGAVRPGRGMPTTACAQPTACADAMFARASPGTGVERLGGSEDGAYEVYPLARPGCQNSVTPFDGHLYVTPYACACGLEMYGTMCFAPAGEFAFTCPAVEAERLERGDGDIAAVQPLAQTDADWPTYRQGNDRQATTPAKAPAKVGKLWRLPAIPGVETTAPATAGGLVFVGRSNGQVLALDAATGREKWRAYTGGAIRWPPSIAAGRAFVGAGDGWVYCFEAATGRLLWRFRCAPVARKIAVYGRLLSTWPAASGVLVEDGRAYVAAGIASHDGTHVYALDAATGKIVWQDNTCGHIEPRYKGVCVQGHLLAHGGKLYLSAGCGMGVAAWDMKTGRLLRDDDSLLQKFARRVPVGGRELYLYGGKVYQSGNPFYLDLRNERRKDPQMYERTALTAQGDRDVLYTTSHGAAMNVLCFRKGQLDGALPEVGREPGAEPLWRVRVGRGNEFRTVGRATESVVVAANAVLASQYEKLSAYDLNDGKALWAVSLPQQVIYWGLAVDRDGRVLATLLDGSVQCLGEGR